MTDQEIKEAVARKLGYEKTDEPDGVYWLHPDGDNVDSVLPDYCHSIAAAWEIVEHLNADKFEFIRTSGLPKVSASFKFQNPETREIAHYWAVADTAPMAICLAFLKLEG